MIVDERAHLLAVPGDVERVPFSVPAASPYLHHAEELRVSVERQRLRSRHDDVERGEELLQRHLERRTEPFVFQRGHACFDVVFGLLCWIRGHDQVCLLYTSDAADEED